MDIAKIQEILISKPAIVVYELITLAILIVLCVILSRKWRNLKKRQEELHAQQERQILDDALINQKRRYER